MSILINDLIAQLIHIQQGKNWIGVNFQQRLNSLSDEDFFYQPSGMHSIAEIISHLTTWRNETVLKIKTGKGSITDNHPSNWPPLELLKTIGKDGLLRHYDESMVQLIKELKNKNDSFLGESYFDTDFDNYYPYSFVINGMVHHDLYHLGQIGLIIKMQKLHLG